MINVYIQLYKDSFNKTSFPTKGEKVEILTKLVNNFSDHQIYPSFILNYRHNVAFELGPRLSMHIGVSGGLALGDSIPYPYRSYIGGLGYYHKSIFPFVGMNYMERAANHSLIVRADFQYNIKGNHYFLWRNNTGKSFNSFPELKNLSSTLFGTGLTYGYSTPFGPIEGTVMISNNNRKPLLFINIGYWIK
jgi:NTE family protein